MGDSTNTQDAGKEGKQAQAKHGFKNGKHQGRGPNMTQSLNSDAAVPMLRFGVGNNYDLFRRKISIACIEKYKNFGRLIIDEEYCTPPKVDTALYDLSNDP